MNKLSNIKLNHGGFSSVFHEYLRKYWSETRTRPWRVTRNVIERETAVLALPSIDS